MFLPLGSYLPGNEQNFKDVGRGASGGLLLKRNLKETPMGRFFIKSKLSK